ncbi:MAG TPA: hypothetical protein VK465_13600 [Fibrobacteria bacterium]|nr:hypothetical protein [Fibrobacteria bacterium]
MHLSFGALPRYPRLLNVILLLGTAAFQDAQARRAVNTCLDITDQARGRSNTLINVSTPTLVHTVTNFDPSWFDLENPERSPTLFMLTLNLPDSLAGRVRLKMIVTADTSLGRNDDPGARVVALDRMSQPLDATTFNRPLRSNDVFEFDWVSGYGTRFQESDLFDVVAGKRQAPEMNLHFSFALTCEGDETLFAATTTVEISELGGAVGRLRYVKNLQALYPGTQVSNPRPVNVYTINPIFKVISELFNRVEYEYPPGEPKIEVFLHELLAGERPEDAVNGIEFAKFGMFDESPMAYPAHLPRLEPGRTYVWRARANLRGPTSDYLFSKPLYFKVDERLEGGSGAIIPASELTDSRSIEQQIKFGDDYAKRVLAALKVILGENFEVFDLSRAGKLPAKGQIRLNGHPYSLEELERLAREFHQSKHSLTRLRFQ